MCTEAGACWLCPDTVKVVDVYRRWSLLALPRYGESLHGLPLLDSVGFSQTGQSQDDGG